MFYQLPPVGNPVCLAGQSGEDCSDKKSSAAALVKAFGGYAFLYGSGTAALAAAVVASLSFKKIKNAEVILPAYACPDLLSAIIFAGAKPVLVDLEADRPWLDLLQLEKAINSNTAAIVAVNLFGIAERWADLTNISRSHELVLIEDSAQYFPGAGEKQEWHGDMVVVSFGRGKPVSLLGGGAVITKDMQLFELMPKPVRAEQGYIQRFMFFLKARIYNMIISPYIYWLLQLLPFLHLGETRYHELLEIDAISKVGEDILAVNMACYQGDEQAIKCYEKLSEILSVDERLLDLPRLCEMSLSRRLLRYPVLVDTVLREKIIQKFQKAGLGVSRMYPVILPEVEGCQGMFPAEEFPNARSFASKVFTLPTHKKVVDADIKNMRRLFFECLNNN